MPQQSGDAGQFDFFVSYARRDNASGLITGFVEALLDAHQQASGGRMLTCFFDTQDIASFDDWQRRILNAGLARSRLFLAIISPSYFASEWCRREWRAWVAAEIARHILFSAAAPVYFVEVPGFAGGVPGLHDQETRSEQVVARRVAYLCGLPMPHEDFIAAAGPVVRQMRERRKVATQFVKPITDQGLAALRSEDLRRALAGLAKDLDERSESFRRVAESANTVPPYNRNFSGRLDELLLLRDRLDSDRVAVVSGVHSLGGIGKTELAFTYAHAFANAYPGGRFLLPCEGKSSLLEAALCLGDVPDFRARISDEERKTPTGLSAAVTRALAERLAGKGPILLVLDNVTYSALVSSEQTGVLTALGPHLHLLATTRWPAPADAHWLTLGELPEYDALDLLEKHRPFAGDKEWAAARSIAKRLGGFPLAIELVAAWLAANPVSGYVQVAGGLGLEDFERVASEEDAELRRHNHERRLTAVLATVLRELRPVERCTLEYAALLPPDSIALPWLRALVRRELPDAFRSTPYVADPWRRVKLRLLHLALFTRAEIGTDEPRIVRVHRLVQELLRRGMPEDQMAERAQAIVELVRARNSALDKTAEWKDAQWELEPFEALAWRWAETGNIDAAAWLLNQAGLRWHELGEWPRAEAIMRRALPVAEQSFGPDHPNVAKRLNNLALLLAEDKNRLAEAEPLLRRALAIDEQSFGPDHPAVAIRLNNLALLLKNTNRLAAAEPLMRRVLALDEKSFGPNHPAVAGDLNNLARLLRTAHGPAEAEPLMRRALMILRASLGQDHPSTQTAARNYAVLLQQMGRSREEVLAFFESELGWGLPAGGPHYPGSARAIERRWMRLRHALRWFKRHK